MQIQPEQTFDYQTSRFWKRIASHPSRDGDMEALTGLVGQVAAQAKTISGWIVKHLDQFTLHDETHFKNVLRLMDALVPELTIEQLSPIECALAILAAYTHDLGMALPDDEAASLPQNPDFREFRDGHALRHAIEDARRRDTNESRSAIPVLEQHIVADYLRGTHAAGDAPPGGSRVGGWLDRIEEIIKRRLEHRGIVFKHHLELLGLSHGQEIGWICHRLKRRWPKQPEFAFAYGGGQTLNLPYLSWLLRLADIMDLDSSRAPAIVLKHLGIRDGLSVAEWQKHRAVVDYRYESDSGVLVYHAPECPNPYIEKRIRETVQCINAELRNVEWERLRLVGADLRDKYAIALPREAQTRIDAAWEHGRPRYEYHDYRFELRQDEILEILMGEQLYGEPELCIRELLQNALDALELRDMRLRLPPDECLEPVDPLRLDEQLHVELTWGEDDGRPFIRMRDNGVGMTRRIIEQYFMQVGRSYYRSSEFEAERAAFRRHGQAISPISRFGIGILSCFMLADQVVVKTCPCDADRNWNIPEQHRIRKPYEVRITGAGSLFWLREWDNPPGPGTEITLYLKSGLRVGHDATGFHDQLRRHFHYDESQEHEELRKLDHIDPPLVAAQTVVWPKYPIQCRPEAKETHSEACVFLDDRFHFRELLVIDEKRLEENAAECGLSPPPDWLRQIDWSIWNWEDAGHTGTRILLALPTRRLGSENPFDQAIYHEAAWAMILVEPQLPTFFDSRNVVLVSGMMVEEPRHVHISISPSSSLAAHVSGVCWIDLRGRVAPILRADRKAATRRQPESLKSEYQQMWERFNRHLRDQLGEVSLDGRRLAASGFKAEVFWQSTQYQHPARAWCPFKLAPSGIIGLLFYERLLQKDLNHNDAWNLDRAQSLALALAVAIAGVRHRTGIRGVNRDPKLGHPLDVDLDIALILSRRDAPERVFADKLSRKLAHALADDLSRKLAQAVAHDLDHNLQTTGLVRRLINSLGVLQRLPLLNEAFQPSLERALPAINEFNRRGSVGHAVLSGPLALECEYAEDGYMLIPADPLGQATLPWIGDYDLVSPLTAIPLGPLRAQCPLWMTKRHYRALAILPFVFGGRMKVNDFESLWAWYHEHLLVPDLFLLLPDETLFDKLFADWTDDDWRDHVWSAYWRIDGDTVLWAPGRRTRAEMHAVLTNPQPDIQTLDDWIGAAKA